MNHQNSRNDLAASLPSGGASRRDLLQGLAAAGVGALVPASGLIAQNGGATPRRIDMHHHYQLPGTGRGEGAGWTPEKALEVMDQHGVETTILSRPGGEAYDGTEKGATFARRINEYGAKMVSDHPKRFGFFAVIPFPDTKASLAEIEYSFDTLKADGFSLMSSIGNKWPGDPAFDEVWAEMNRRKLIGFMHPLVPPCCTNLIPGGAGSVERDFDTTRAVTNLLYSGTLSKYPDIRYIINHSGATLPVLAGRIKDRVPGFSTYGGKKLANHDGKTDKIPNGVFYELTKLYYECAHAAYPAAMAALLAFAPPSQFLFGTDWPAEPMESTLDELPKSKLSPQVMRALNRGNAERLFPRLKT
jgi:predicted TIM-barrel fold metal-dependent hydrolase